MGDLYVSVAENVVIQSPNAATSRTDRENQMQREERKRNRACIVAAVMALPLAPSHQGAYYASGEVEGSPFSGKYRRNEVLVQPYDCSSRVPRQGQGE